MIRLPPRPTLLPYTTLFRSRGEALPAQNRHHPPFACIVLPADRPLRHASVERGSPGRHPFTGTIAVVSLDRKSTRLNYSHANISYAVFCLKKKKNNRTHNYN